MDLLVKYSVTAGEKERLQLERKILKKKMRETLERWRDITETAMKCSSVPSGTLQALEFLQAEIEEALQ